MGINSRAAGEQRGSGSADDDDFLLRLRAPTVFLFATPRSRATERIREDQRGKREERIESARGKRESSAKVID